MDVTYDIWYDWRQIPIILWLKYPIAFVSADFQTTNGYATEVIPERLLVKYIHVGDLFNITNTSIMMNKLH